MAIQNTTLTGDAVASPVSLRSSVLIVSYNNRADLPRCLSALQRTLDSSSEVVLVDNCSADGSAELVAADFPWVRLIRNSSNEGFAAATNRAAEAASGAYLVALNPDTEVRPGWLEALIAPLARPGARVGLTTARILLSSDPLVVNTCGNNMHLTGITVCRGLGLAADAAALARPRRVSAVSGACFAISRELWAQLGGLDESFFTYLEDTDLSLRARLAGYECLYVPGAAVLHDYVGRFSAQKLYYLERNRLLMLAKSLRRRTLLLLLPALLLAETLTWGFALKSGAAHLRAKANAYRWLVGQRAAIRQSRRRVQAARRASDRELVGGLLWRLDMTQLAGGFVGRVGGAVVNPLFHLLYRIVVALAR